MPDTLAPLKLGSTGRAVEFLQCRLAVPVSGQFDQLTQTALTAAQTARGLTPDGVYGPLTNSVLTARSASAIADAAASIGVEAAAFGAIVQVESSGAGFCADGRPKILLERHYVWQLATPAQRALLPDSVCSPTPGGYVGGVGEWDRFEQVAKAVGVDIAVQSCSWGLGQIMGRNFWQYGYATPGDFVRTAGRDESAQVLQMAQFLRVDPAIIRALRAKDWATVARLYNGPNYAIGGYDKKLALAYSQLSK